MTHNEAPSSAALGEADLPALADRVAAAFAAWAQGDAECRDEAARLALRLKTATEGLAERAFMEFSAQDGWSAERRQIYSLNVIAARVEETKATFAASGAGEDVLGPVVDLVRETYFARLAEVARGAQAAPGRA